MLSDVVNPRLVKVEEMVNSDMKTQSENVHTLQQEMEKIMNDFRLQAYNIDLTIMAMLEILEESEIKIADFSKRVGERKREIDQKLIDAVEADKKAKVEAESVAALEKQPEAPVAS